MRNRNLVALALLSLVLWPVVASAEMPHCVWTDSADCSHAVTATEGGVIVSHYMTCGGETIDLGGGGAYGGCPGDEF